LKVGGDAAAAFKPFFFAQLADTQIGMLETFKIWGSDDVPLGWDEEIRLMKMAVREINRLNPAFAIVCGDLVDSVEGYPEELLRKRPDQVRDFKQAWTKCTVPLVCVCGNHDVGNTPTPATVWGYRRDFGSDFFAFTRDGTRCIVVNSQLWKDDSGCKELRAKHDAWLVHELESEACKNAQHIIVFMHIPPFIRKFDEPDGYFNLSNKEAAAAAAAAVETSGGDSTGDGAPALRQWLMSLFARHGVKTVFCGHYHRNAGGVYTGPDGPDGADRSVEVVVTGAVGTNVGEKEGAPVGSKEELNIVGMGKPIVSDEVSGMRIVEVRTGGVQHTWYNFKQLPDVAAPQLDY
jgi:hypothetical protein